MPRQLDPHWLDHHDRQDRYVRRGPSDSETAVEDLLRTWIGDDSDASLEMSEHRRAPLPIAQILSRIVPRLRAQVSDDLTLLSTRWSEIAGRDVSRLCAPDAVRDGVLDVAVASGAAMYVLRIQYLSQLRSAVSAATGGRVRDVKLRPAGRRGPVAR
jgi:hypothetical protein